MLASLVAAVIGALPLKATVIGVPPSAAVSLAHVSLQLQTSVCYPSLLIIGAPGLFLQLWSSARPILLLWSLVRFPWRVAFGALVLAAGALPLRVVAVRSSARLSLRLWLSVRPPRLQHGGLDRGSLQTSPEFACASPDYLGGQQHSTHTGTLSGGEDINCSRCSEVGGSTADGHFGLLSTTSVPSRAIW